MINVLPLHQTINTTAPVTKDLIYKWNTCIPDLMLRGAGGNTKIDPVIAKRYRYDFYGLLGYMGIDSKYHYPHLVVNGYSNPLQFNGTIYTVTLLSPEILDNYYRAFTR